MATETKAKIIDFEVLPPATPEASNVHHSETGKAALARLVALLMDDLFKVPGTRWRFGLNPILDLIPAVGDGSAAMFSGLTLFTAIRYRIPKIVIARMGTNVLVNAVIGLIPGVGEAFAFWFRPSSRNYQLLKKHLPVTDVGQPPSTRKDWLFVMGTVTVLFLLFVLCAIIEAYVFLWLLRSIFGSSR